MSKNKLISTVVKHSYLEYEEGDSEDNMLTFSTRANGDVLNEIYSPDDYKEALRIKKYILELFDSEIANVSVDTVDEWVMMEIYLNS